MRVTDDMVRSFLVWAKNYDEIAGYQKIAKTGSKWKITLHESVEASNMHGVISHPSRDRIVPQEIVLTNREALVFGYGCAVAGRNKARSEYAEEHWNV